MKTTNLFKAVAFVAMTIVSVMNTEVKAQENNFITNEEVKNELVVAKTIFKQDGAQLYRHIRYEYSYDDQKRLTCKEASKWDGVKDEWVPYFKMTYQYGNDEITMSYARWNSPILILVLFILMISLPRVHSMVLHMLLITIGIMLPIYLLLLFLAM